MALSITNTYEKVWQRLYLSKDKEGGVSHELTVILELGYDSTEYHVAQQIWRRVCNLAAVYRQIHISLSADDTDYHDTAENYKYPELLWHLHAGREDLFVEELWQLTRKCPY